MGPTYVSAIRLLLIHFCVHRPISSFRAHRKKKRERRWRGESRRSKRRSETQRGIRRERALSSRPEPLASKSSAPSARFSSFLSYSFFPSFLSLFSKKKLIFDYWVPLNLITLSACNHLAVLLTLYCSNWLLGYVMALNQPIWALWLLLFFFLL